MSFTLFVDSGANLPFRKLQELDIRVISFPMVIDGVETESPQYPDGFDGHQYYARLKAGGQVQTSLINMETFTRSFAPELEAGQDVLYVGISSGITGTVQSARLAAQELQERYPGRQVEVVDSMGVP